MDALISAGAIALLDAVADGITIQDPSGRLIYANPAAARITGFASPDEMLALPLDEIRDRYELFDEFDRPLPYDHLPSTIALSGVKDPTPRLVQFRVRATKETHWANLRSQPVFNADGTIRFAVSITHDLTELVERQRALEEASALLEETAAELETTVQQLEERTDEAEARASRHKFLAEAGRMLAASLETEDTLRMIVHLAVPRLAEWADVSLVREDGSLERLEIAHADPAQLRKAFELDRRYPRDPQLDAGYRVARTGVSEMYSDITDEMIRASAQSDEHYEMIKQLDLRSAMIVPMKVQEKVLGIISFVRNSSQKRYDQEDLEFAESLAARSALALANARLYREAQEANRTKSDFLAVMSHELRTPLTAIFGYAELLSTGVSGEMTETQRAHLDRIHASAAQLLTIIEDILAYARTEAGRDEVHTDAFRLSEVINDAVLIVKPNVEKKGLKLKVTVAEDVLLQTDRAKLRQILINLVGNAVKFTESGSISISSSHVEERSLELVVEDTGIGIPEQDYERIFEPFRQLEPSMTRKAGGTGLGLAVSRRFAALLGGTISVHSQLGTGTRFTVRVPVQKMP
jgi:signal transduction histidine kinase/DNA-binding transcriptional MerR regulator